MPALRGRLALPPCRDLALPPGGRLVLLLGRGIGRTMVAGLALPPSRRLGVHAMGEHHHVQTEPRGERGDPPDGGHHPGAPSQHQAAVDDHSEQVLIGLQRASRAPGSSTPP